MSTVQALRGLPPAATRRIEGYIAAEFANLMALCDDLGIDPKHEPVQVQAEPAEEPAPQPPKDQKRTARSLAGWRTRRTISALMRSSGMSHADALARHRQQRRKKASKKPFEQRVADVMERNARRGTPISLQEAQYRVSRATQAWKTRIENLVRKGDVTGQPVSVAEAHEIALRKFHNQPARRRAA